MRQILRRDPLAMILYRQKRVPRFSDQADTYGFIFARMTDRVVDQIADRAFQSGGISADNEIFLNFCLYDPAFPLDNPGVILRDNSRDCAEIHCLRRDAVQRRQFGILQNFIYKRGKPVRFAFDHGGVCPALRRVCVFLQHFRITADHGQRRAQVVGHIGEQFPLIVFCSSVKNSHKIK